MTGKVDARPDGEEAIIQTYLAPLAAGFEGALRLKDDCAVLVPRPGHDIVLKTDPVAAGVHFLADDDAADIGWKALAVNVSDLAAKGATPRAYLMALSFPEAPAPAWMVAFARGLGEAQTAFGIHLAGGDTDRRPGPVTVSITVLGEVPAGRMVQRGTAQAGDDLYVTGTLGDSALGLRLCRDALLASRWGITPSDALGAIARYRRPQPRLAICQALLAHARAAMDLSDGLAKDLARMAGASGCGAEVALSALPLSSAGRAVVAGAGTAQAWQLIAATGDDYEVLCSVAPERSAAFAAAATALAAAADPPFAVSRIGRMTASSGVRLVDAEGRPFEPARSGWDHF